MCDFYLTSYLINLTSLFLMYFKKTSFTLKIARDFANLYLRWQ